MSRMLEGPPTAETLAGLHHAEPVTFAVFDAENLPTDSALAGQLFVTETVLVWWSESAGRGFELDWSSVVLHAICRDTSAFPAACIYCQIDSGDELGPQELRLVPQTSEEQDGLGLIFKAMSECQALNPDEDDMESGEDDGAFMDADDFAEEEDSSGLSPRGVDVDVEGAGAGTGNRSGEAVGLDEVELTAEGRSTLDRLERLLIQEPIPASGASVQDDDGMFNDAD